MAGGEALDRARLAALLAEVLPSTSGPGATEANAADYVLRRAARDLGTAVALASVLHAAGEQPAPAAFAALVAADHPVWRQLRAWAWEGYLCDPVHGGNRGQIGWDRFGAGPRVKGRAGET